MLRGITLEEIKECTIKSHDYIFVMDAVEGYYHSLPPALTYEQIENVFGDILLFIKNEGYFPSSSPCYRVIETGKLKQYIKQALKTMMEVD